MTILRSLLFVPGNKANMLDKALGLAPDAFVPDMEDSVPAAEKANARETIRSFLPKLAARGRIVIPRVNALDTDWFEPDVAAVVGRDIFGISIGKVRTAEDISEISQALAEHERRARLDVGHLKLLPWIETHPYLGKASGYSCNRCGSKNLTSQGEKRTRHFRIQSLKCSDCGGWRQGLRKKIA